MRTRRKGFCDRDRCVRSAVLFDVRFEGSDDLGPGTLLLRACQRSIRLFCQDGRTCFDHSLVMLEESLVCLEKGMWK